ncbi:phage tail assembly protein [Heliorestis acidaminivorans]|uniref:Phage tail assembly protein n=1 Tax=Heliorestis acidaminivorans TaxID=553427 RepID=A0A6I0EZ85_9FIRM|nr:phage tail assembly protein [Heliorestis acidaminivorans]KAB2951955.1 phage tail assembly protein [Heliorestis acidaminivorans]
MSLQTEFPFVLPKGYVDKSGNVHRKGIMRLATAADEIMPLKDIRVQQNQSYLSIMILSRVITELGELKNIDVRVIENLFTPDLAYLQDFYQNINQVEPPKYKFNCSNCNQANEVSLNFFEP